MPSALVLLAEGAEEMETVITVDVLRRGGVSVTVAGLAGDQPVKCSRDVTIAPDTSLEAAQGQEYDVVVCPGGGGGADRLAASAAVGALLKQQEARGAYIACVCAAPIALLSHGIGRGKTITSHPGVADRLKQDYVYTEDRVAVDGRLVTSRGPGTCFEFALKLVELLQGQNMRDSLVGPMLLKL